MQTEHPVGCTRRQDRSLPHDSQKQVQHDLKNLRNFHGKKEIHEKLLFFISLDEKQLQFSLI